MKSPHQDSEKKTGEVVTSADSEHTRLPHTGSSRGYGETAHVYTMRTQFAPHRIIFRVFTRVSPHCFPTATTNPCHTGSATGFHWIGLYLLAVSLVELHLRQSITTYAYRLPARVLTTGDFKAPVMEGLD